MARMPYTNFHDINLDWIIKRVMKAYSPDNPPDSDDIIDTDSGLNLTVELRKKQNRPESDGTVGQVLGLDNDLQPVWLTPQGGGGGVTDVQIDGTSILDQYGVANIPIASANVPGVLKIAANSGLALNVSNQLQLQYLTDLEVKNASGYNALTPAWQSKAVFYGLAQVAGLVGFAGLTYGTYTDAAIDKILTLLGVYNRILSPAGNTHTLLPCPFSYAFGEKAELNITVTATSEYHFSFSCPAGTPTVLTMTGATATAGDVILEAGGYYEVNVWNGVALYRKVEVTGG